jgi:hypothetical protein
MPISFPMQKVRRQSQAAGTGLASGLYGPDARYLCWKRRISRIDMVVNLIHNIL